MTQIDALLAFAQHEKKEFFKANRPNRKDAKDPLSIAEKRCNAYIAQARKIRNGEKPDWVPGYEKVAELLNEFAPGVYELRSIQDFSRKE